MLVLAIFLHSFMAFPMQKGLPVTFAEASDNYLTTRLYRMYLQGQIIEMLMKSVKIQN